jgi:Pvc16 N-terminal domain
MSNTLAIGAVTSALQQMLNVVGKPLPGDPPTDPDLADAHCTARSLDVARDHGDKRNQLNLFLYQLKESSTFRNMNLPNVHDGEGGQQPLSLLLYYVLTGYGGNDDDILAHRMLGRAMLMLHDHSTMTREQLKTALPGSDLWQQAERVRIRPLPLGPEEISKLWTGFGKPYRLSVGYEVSVVLIESVAPKIAQLPVLSRGPVVPGTPPGMPPRESGVKVDATLDSSYPSLDHFAGTLNRPAMRLGESVTLFGASLAAVNVVSFKHPLNDAPITVTVAMPHAADQIVVPIPSDAGAVNAWPAGIYTVTASDPSGRSTNAIAVPLAPTITIAAAGAVITVTVTPNIRFDHIDVPPMSSLLEQSVALLIDGRILLPDQPAGLVVAAPNKVTFTVPDPPSGTVYVRLRVDGIDSIVIADYTKSPPTFDPLQSITLP